MITYYNIITVEEAQYSAEDMNDYAMVNLVQGITHIHLKQTEMRHQPKCIEEQVIS